MNDTFSDSDHDIGEPQVVDMCALKDSNRGAYNNILNSITTWPFRESRKLWQHIGERIPDKGYVLFASGYGPSGLPHIGTAAEIARVNMVKRAFDILYPEVPTKFFIFSDDLDGLRKIPANFPKESELLDYIGVPVCNIPDPFDQYRSYAAQMNARLKNICDSMNIDGEIKACSQLYQSGSFNKTIKLFMQNVEKIKSVITEHFGEERRSTYEPFLPISPTTGKFVMSGYTGYNNAEGKIQYVDSDGEHKESSVYDGQSKLQWLADWAMRWICLDVNYEMHGKDITPSAIVGHRICGILGIKGPLTKQYELFVDDNNKKISKSKNNGISLEEWMDVADYSVLGHYLYYRPERTKKLTFNVIPEATDQYIENNSCYFYQSIREKIANPIWYVHGFEVPPLNAQNVNFSLILDLAKSVNNQITDEEMIKLLCQHTQNTELKNSPYITKMIERARKLINKLPKNVSNPNNGRKKNILLLLAEKLAELGENPTNEAVHEVFVSIACSLSQSIQDIYKEFYITLIDKNNGPKAHTLISLMGLKNICNKIKESIE